MDIDMVVKLSFLIVFAVVMVGVGLYCRKRATDVEGFVLGGRKVGPWLTAFAYGTSYFSAVVFVGYAGQFGWRYGIAATWTGLANAFLGSYLAWVVLGRRTRVMTHYLNSATMPQFFGSRFNSKSLMLLSAAVIFIFLIPYTASLYNGLSRLFEMAFNIDYAVCVVAMAVLTGIYVIAGGYMATAVNDFFQGTIMIAGIIAVIAAVLNTHGGFMGSLDGLARISDPAVSSSPGIFASFFGPDPFNLLGVMILTSLGTWGLPQMVQKFYAIHSENAIDKGTMISTVFAVIVAGGCYFLGGFARLFSDRVDVAKEGYDAIIPAMLSGLPTILIAIVVILVLSASMSTLSSLVLTSSSTLTLDFLKQSMKKDMTERQQLFVMRLLIVVFIAISAVIAVFQYRTNVTFIAQLMGVSWGALAGAFLAPFLYGLYWRRVTGSACIVNLLFATIVMVANMTARQYFPDCLKSPINAGAFCMLAGMVIVPLISMVTRAPEASFVARIFACYERKVTVSVTHSIETDDAGR